MFITCQLQTYFDFFVGDQCSLLIAIKYFSNNTMSITVSFYNILNHISVDSDRLAT